MADLSGLLATLWMIGSVAVGLGLVIFVHELGHFLAAKACGVKCEKFYIGFDIPLRLGPLKFPSALCKFRWGETEYGVGILPLGGYVKMLGQDDDPRNQVKENERIKQRKQQDEAVAASQGVATGEQAGPSAGADRRGGEESPEEFELDPRSFPAKPVWQRMIIISAGVAMNLASAVVFAAVAYQMGVSYTPCVLGGTAPGDPAWVQGIEPGDKILQIGREGLFGQDLEPSEHLRFDKDLMINVTLHGADRPLDLLIRSPDQSAARWVTVSPSDRLEDVERPATLGVRPAYTTELDPEVPCDPACRTEEGYALLEGGDEIVAVEGQRLPRDEQTGVIFEHHLERMLARLVAEPVTLTVRRRGPRAVAGDVALDVPAAGDFVELDVTLPPNPLRKLGLVMQAGPIVGVRQGTPADVAGFRQGDVLVAVDGQEIGDPFTLNQRLLEFVGQEVEFVVRRGDDGNRVSLRATPEPPAAYADNFGPGSPVPLETLGIAFDVQNVVVGVQPDSPAARGGLQAGDKILEAAFLVEGRMSGEPVPLVEQAADGSVRDLANWAYVHSAMNALSDAQLVLTYGRGDSKQTVTLAPETSDQWYHASRRLNTMSFTRVRTAGSWSEAWALGYEETTTSLKQVLVVLQRLFTGQISYKSMGGPIMIARAAGAEASRGIPRLLVFLTFLSANLAILNFLPIPALDGGHMVFLAAEGIRGKPVNERLQVALTLIGVGCLLSLMVLVFALDIHRLDLLRWIR
jgi:regulator of sigma E protease